MPDMHNLLVKLIDDVGDMGYGDPYDDTVPRILAADVIRWAVAEIERHRMTPQERAVMKEVWSDASYRAMRFTAETVIGYLARTKPKEVGRE